MGEARRQAGRRRTGEGGGGGVARLMYARTAAMLPAYLVERLLRARRIAGKYQVRQPALALEHERHHIRLLPALVADGSVVVTHGEPCYVGPVAVRVPQQDDATDLLLPATACRASQYGGLGVQGHAEGGRCSDRGGAGAPRAATSAVLRRGACPPPCRQAGAPVGLGPGGGPGC